MPKLTIYLNLQLNVTPILLQNPNLVITVPADVLAHNSARSSANTALIAKYDVSFQISPTGYITHKIPYKLLNWYELLIGKEYLVRILIQSQVYCMDPVSMPWHALTGPEPGQCYWDRPSSGPVKAGYGMFTGEVLPGASPYGSSS